MTDLSGNLRRYAARIAALEAQVALWRQRALKAEAEVADLRLTEDDRRRVDRAVRIVMARQRVPQVLAYQMLVEVSAKRHRTLVEVSREVLEAGWPAQ